MNSYEEQEKAAYRKAETLIAEQNRKHKIVFRAAVSSCVCTAACAGIWLLTSDNIKSLPKNDPSVSTIIEYDPSVPEVNDITVTTAHDLPVITISTSSSAVKKTLTTNISSTEMKKAATQTTAKNSQTFTQTSAVSSTAETVHTENTSQVQTEPSEVTTVPEQNVSDRITLYDKSELKPSDIHFNDDMTLYKLRTADIESNGTTRKAEIFTITESGKENQTTLNGEKNYYVIKYVDSDEYLVYEPDKTPAEKTVDNTTYTMYHGENGTIFRSFTLSSVPGEKLGSYLGRAQFEELIVEGERPKAEGDMYEIQGISSDYAVAIKVDGSEKYTIFYDVYYTPQTIGEMLDEQGLFENMIVVGASVAHDEPVKYTISPEMVTEILEDARDLKRCQNDGSYLNGYVKIIFDLPLYNLYDRVIHIYGNGYMNIRSVSSTICVYIGEEKAQEFISKVKSEGFPEDW